MRKTITLFFALIGGLSTLGLSQGARITGTGPDKGLGLAQVVEIALRNNLQIKQSQVAVQNSELTLKQSQNNKLPAVNSNIGYSTNFGRGIDFISNTYTNQTISNNNMGLNLDVPIYQGNSINNTIKRNDLELKASQQDFEAMKNNIALQVVLAYLNMLNFEDQVAIAKAQTDITKQQIARTEKLVQAGSLPISNLFDLKSQLANEEATIVTNQGNLDTAELTLLQLMNDPNITDIQLDRISIEAPTNSEYGTTSTDIYTIAEKEQPAIKAADLRVRSGEIGVKIAGAGLLPSLSFNGGAFTGYGSAGKDFVTRERIPYFRQLNQNFSQQLGLNLNIPIFNRNANKTRIQQSNLTRINNELQAQNARLTLKQNIEQAYVNMINSAKRYESFTVQVMALQESFRAAESRYNAGTIDFVAYNLQKTNLDRARANQIQAKYDYVLRTKILDFYQNKPLTF